MCAAVLVFSACKEDKIPEVTKPCDVANPAKYSSDVKPIIDSYCKACHQPGGAYSSLPLTTATEVKNAIISNKLMQTIKHEAGVSAMPQGGSKLSDADIAKIQCWIDGSYKD